MDNISCVVGIDVSKDTFNAHFGFTDSKHSNNSKGFRELLKIAPKNSVYAMEATGFYHYKLACYLHSKGCKVMVLNPYKVKHWIISNSDKANDDKRAAVNISGYAEHRISCGVSFWEPMPPKLARARAIVSLLCRLSKFSVSCSSVNHAISFMLGKTSNLLGYMPDVDDVCKNHRSVLKKELCSIVKEIYPSQFRLLQTIPGIGANTAAVFCVLSRGMENFSDCRRLVSFVGLAPRFHESGISIKSRRRISKTGNSYFRGLLYMCAMTAVKYNKPCKDLYDRLICKGKNGMCSLSAVMHRLVKISFGVVKSGEPYRGGRVVFS